MICHKYLRQWLNIPVCGPVEILQLNMGIYGQEILDISSKYTICQLTFLQCLKNSMNEDIRNLHNVTSNIQYNSFQTTKAALKMIREETRAKIESLEVQGAVINEIWKTALLKAKDA